MADQAEMTYEEMHDLARSLIFNAAIKDVQKAVAEYMNPRDPKKASWEVWLRADAQEAPTPACRLLRLQVSPDMPQYSV
jgi:hypothetical protein